jgi:hypothetical protein
MDVIFSVQFETTFRAANYELAFSLTSMTNGQLWIGTAYQILYGHWIFQLT